MSAAEQPADPARISALNAGGGGSVIDIARRRRGGGHTTAQGRWAMAAPAGSDPGQAEGDSLRLVAGDLETSFNAISQSLTEPRTAAAFLKTLDIWERALQGSHATGIITAEQLGDLVAVIRGMREAPRLV